MVEWSSGRVVKWSAMARVLSWIAVLLFLISGAPLHCLPQGQVLLPEGPCRSFGEQYREYLDAYYARIGEKPECLTTVRPLGDLEYVALMSSIIFVRSLAQRDSVQGEKDFLNDRYRMLETLVRGGRIKYDDDPREIACATKMTTHSPSDLSDPFRGDIYVHEEGLLQGVYLPFRGLRMLEMVQIPPDVKASKQRIYERSAFEGIVLLSSYLIHECRHRLQRKPVPDGESESSRYRCLLEMEDPAYSDQYIYLSIAYRNTADKSLKLAITSLRDTIVKEVNARFPELKHFRDLQKEWPQGN